MEKNFISLPVLAKKLLDLLLPRQDHEQLMGYYEAGFIEIKNKKGKNRAFIWLWKQILWSFPSLMKLKLTGEIIMIRNYFITAFRNIFRHKGYSLINIAGLAIGLACCMLIFLWIKHEWSYDRFHENKENIYRIVVSWPRGNETGRTWRTPPPLAVSLQNDLVEVEAASRFYTVSDLLVEREDNHFKETIGFADPALFSIFTLPMEQGDQTSLLSDPQSIVISESTARKFFGQEDPVGKSMVVNDNLIFHVSAVIEDIPKNSILDCPIFIPFSHLENITNMGNEKDWGDFGYNTFVLLGKNVDPGLVNLKLKDYLDVKWENPDNDTELALQPLTSIHLYALGGGGPIVYIWIFSIIAVFILLIACINFMNLATARSAARAKEIGIRKVIGAERKRIMQQFLCESLFLSFIALIVALLIVGLSMRTMLDLVDVSSGSRLFNLSILPLFIVITIATGILAGIYPALFLSSFRTVQVLKGKQRSGSPLFRKVLVVFQFSISVFLLIGLFLVSRQMNFLHEKPLGFSKEQIVYISLNETLVRKFEPFRQELLNNSGVLHVSAVSNYLGQGPKWSTSGIKWEGKDPDDGYSLSILYADYGFADTFQLELAAGRFFSREYESDKNNFVVNETAVQGMDVEIPLDMEISISGQHGRIIGVLKDFHFGPLHNEVQPLAVIMQPVYYRYAAVKIRSEDVPVTIGNIEKTFEEFSPKYPFEYTFLDEILDLSYKAEQRSQILLKYFVLLAVFISCMGLFGLASFMAEKRTKEIGIRKVLGASETGIFVLISRSFVIWVLISNLIAWPLAYFAMNRWLQNFAYRAPISLWSFIFAGIISLGITLLTISWQSLRVARRDPAHTLKYE